MEVTPEQAALLRYVLAEFTRRRQLCGQPIPRQVRRLIGEVSVSGTSPREVEPDSELIDTTEAARLLHCTPRNVRRIASDLDGHQIAGRWVFHRADVIEYAQHKEVA